MLIIHGKILTFGEEDKLIEDGAIHIVDGHISEIGSSSSLLKRFPSEETVDAGGKLVLPGNICAHTHFYGAFARGMAIPGEAPRDFPEILEKLWWRLDRALDADAVRFSALVCLIDAIRHGTTTLIDHHASPSVIDGSLDIIADAVLQAGVRASLCYEVSDRNGEDEALAGIEENRRFIQRLATDPHPLLGASFGLHASMTLSDTTLERCRSAADGLDVGFHIHAAEGIADEEDSLKRSGKRVVERLESAGILGSKSILVHCVHVDAWEMERIRATGTWVTHQPRSNMNNAVGVAPVEEMVRGGIPVALGNDGFSNNMWAEWKAAYLLHKASSGDPRRMPGDLVMRMAVRNSAALSKIFWPKENLGSLVPGAAADLILVDYKPFTELTSGNFPWHVIFGFEADMVTDTMVAGRWLMRERMLVTLDEEAVIQKAREAARRTWQKYNTIDK